MRVKLYIDFDTWSLILSIRMDYSTMTIELSESQLLLINCAGKPPDPRVLRIAQELFLETPVIELVEIFKVWIFVKHKVWLVVDVDDLLIVRHLEKCRIWIGEKTQKNAK